MTSTTLKSSSSRLKMRKVTNTAMLGLSALAAVVAVGALLFVLVFLVVNGAHSISVGLITRGEDQGGLKNAIAGTLILVATASVIGVPIGLLGGIYQVESKGRFASTIRFLTDVLNSVPSIVIGIFVYILIVVPWAARHPGHGYSAFAGGCALSILMIPTIIRTTEEILRLVPTALREGSLALGATRWRTMFMIVLPAARAGIVTGIMLALARIAGETAPLIFTAFGNTAYSTNLSKPIQSLPWSIFTHFTEPEGRDMAYAGSLILIVLVFMMSLVARFATRNSLLEEK